MTRLGVGQVVRPATGGSGLKSARFTVGQSGTQVVTDSTTGPPGNVIVWTDETFDDIGMAADWATTGDFFVPVEGDYLITVFVLVCADPGVTYPTPPGPAFMEVKINNADTPGIEQQNIPVTLDSIPKLSVSTLLRLHPATQFMVEVTSLNTGIDGRLDSASITLTQTKVL